MEKKENEKVILNKVSNQERVKVYSSHKETKYLLYCQSLERCLLVTGYSIVLVASESKSD